MQTSTFLLIAFTPIAVVAIIAALLFCIGLLRRVPVTVGDVFYELGSSADHKVYVVDRIGAISDPFGGYGRGCAGLVSSPSRVQSGTFISKRPVSLDFIYPNWQLRRDLRRGRVAILAIGQDPQTATAIACDWLAAKLPLNQLTFPAALNQTAAAQTVE